MSTSPPGSTVSSTQVPGQPGAGGRRLLAGAVFFGFVNALWALFQWAELLLARAGSTPFCTVDETFNCSQVWDSAFAVGVHNATQIPIAGWGLIWGIAATVLPLAALVDDRWLGRGLSSSLRLTALGGIASVGAFATASFIAGALCIGCIGTYVLVIIWALLTWRATSSTGFAEAPRGAALAFGVVVVGFLVLLVPGMRTPHAEAKLSIPGSDKPVSSSSSSPKPATVANKDAPAGDFDGPATGDPARDELLERFVGTLDAQSKQLMSDLLTAYRGAKAVSLPAPRDVTLGDPKAALRITEWTDPLCPHCAMLHDTLGEILRTVPPGLFYVESKHFPLDGFCNSGVTRKSEDGLRCVGAKAQICLEGDPKAFEASGALFKARAQTVDAVYEALKPYRDTAKLKKCVASDQTQKALDDDVQQALALNIEGTPLVLFNGREIRPFGPLVYALILTGGADKHPAFRDLPAPRPPAAGGGGHEGHAH